MEKSRINDKILELEKYIEELNKIIPSNFNEYLINFEKKAACERYFERIIEAIIDISFIIAKESNIKIPEEEKGIFDTLVTIKIIKQSLATRLKEAKGMRNIIAHEYGQVEDQIVFNSITRELIKDTKLFLKAIKKFIK